MPEALDRQREKIAGYGLSDYQVKQLTTTRSMSTFALKALADAPPAEIPVLANWIVGPLRARLNEENLDISQSKISPGQLRELAARVCDGTISANTATAEILPAMWTGGGTADAIIGKRGLKQISDAGAIDIIVDQVLAANAKQVADYRAGKDKAFNSLVGQVMKATKGNANPQQVNEILRRKLSG